MNELPKYRDNIKTESALDFQRKNYFCFWLQYLLPTAVMHGTEKNSIGLDPHRKKKFVSGYSSTIVHGTDPQRFRFTAQ